MNETVSGQFSTVTVPLVARLLSITKPTAGKASDVRQVTRDYGLDGSSEMTGITDHHARLFTHELQSSG